MEQALNYIADILSEKTEYKFALKIYAVMPEHKSYRKIRAIYEKGMKLYPEILKYTLMENLH